MASEAEIKELISEITGIETEKIQNDQEFKSDLQMDSIAIADLISSLEEDYDVIIEQEKAMEIKTVSQLIDHVKSL
ncbi:acyl carrier protein [Bacteriovorax sp. DB6_IX]|uniref:acyl carrier protein n=1 Tax=Bacteriovorax sp. DB6_IX TaxID=1353530 RepID=UPI000389FFFE|nr:phosphopantetheine-binding protein [Bacteriovorax sp. DB6_IX]EQC51551.1 putative acyl carrier protein [Bacteriovorax sp. DB6_IX]